MEITLEQFQRAMAKILENPLGYPKPYYINGKLADDEETHFLYTAMQAGIMPRAILPVKGGGTHFITQ